MQHKYIQSLRIVDADGNDKEDISNIVIPVQGNIVFEAGANSAITPDDEGITFTAGYGLNAPDAEMLAKWQAVINGGSGTAHGVSYSFSGMPYFISKIKDTGSLDGEFFLAVDRCYHVGQFLDFQHPEIDGFGALVPAKLSILDTCPACIDCPDFYDIDLYLNKILTAYDLQKDKILDPSTTDPDGKKILDQYMGMIEMWNYIVNLKSWRYNAEAKGGEIYASCKYINHTDKPIPPGMLMTIDFSNAPPNSRAFFVDTAVKNFTRADCLINKLTELSIQLETNAFLPVGGGIRFYCGSLSPDYVGWTTRVSVNFSLDFPVGGIGSKTTGYNTNVMVSIDPNSEMPPWDMESSGP